MAEQYSDLGLGQDYNGQYKDIVIPNLDFETDYAFRVAWIYSDKTKGVSEWSERYNFTTDSESTILAPHFISADLYAINSILYINWDGLNSSLVPYDSAILKKVNVWIKGGDYGEAYKQVHSFTEAGLHQINATKKTTYCVKLQAESKQDNFSAFSSEFCVTMLKQPKAVYDVRHTWDNVGNLSVFWKFDSTFKDATNDNTLADSFGLQLLDETNDVDATWWTAVEKEKLPPLEQKITISANQLQKVFGQFTAFEIDYASFIYVRDKNLQTSLVTGYAITKYTDPLTPPVISAVKAPMAYNVSYTSNSAFDKIYIEESTDSGVTWSSTPFVTSSNPAYIATTNSLARLVRAKFSKKLGGFTGYSNIVTVTPDKIDPTDTTAPTNPTNISATATVDSNDQTGFSLQATISFTKSGDSDCRGYRVRWTTQTANQIYEYGYVDHPSTGSTVSFTVSGLIPNTTYYYQVASVDQFNNTQTYSVAGTFSAQDLTATAEGSLARLKSYISIGGATGDQFKFGTGILDTINTSITTTPAFSAAPVTGYHGILLNKTGNKNNYWLTTGQLRVGTDTQYMYFNGTDLYLTGDINARSGKISGNVTITSGGSFIAGTAGQPRVQMNSTGIFAYGNILENGSLVLAETTQILVDATTDAPTFITTRAKIGNWIVGQNSFSAGGITLNSSIPSILATNSSSYVGIRPKQLDGTDIVLWAGNTDAPAVNSAASGHAAFQVNANGQMRATGAIISGVVSLESGSSLGGLVPDSSKVYYSGTTPLVPTGGHKKGDSWVDTANGNQLKIWSGTQWVITQDSAAALAVANLKTKTTYGPTQPINSILGDVWYDTTAGINYFKVYDGTNWVRMKDSDITAAAQSAADALTEANKKSTTTSSTTAPSSPKAGDIWFDVNFNYFKVWSTTVTPAAWVRLKDGDLTVAQTAISAAQGDATSALSKALKFGTDGSLASNLAVKINDGKAGSIHSSYMSGGEEVAKGSYSSNNPGFFLGWESVSGVIYPAFNVGNDAAYVKYSSSDQKLRISGDIATATGDYWNRDGSFRFGGATGITKSETGSLRISADIATATGDYWNKDGSFRFGGATGITKSTTGSITLGANTTIQGTITASALDTTYTDIDTSGNLTIVNGTKTTTLSNNASLTMSDSSTGWDAGGAINVNSKSSGYYGTEDTTMSLGGNRIQLSRSGGSPSVSYQSYIAHADENNGVSRGTLLILSTAGIALSPSSGNQSGTVLINGKLNPLMGIAANTTIYGSTIWDGKSIRNITVNASAPSGGSEGDIWIQI